MALCGVFTSVSVYVVAHGLSLLTGPGRGGGVRVGGWIVGLETPHVDGGIDR